MIDDTTIRERWDLISTPVLRPGPCTWQSVGLGGALDMKASIEAGTFSATFRAMNRQLTVEEEQQLVSACAIPEHAERVPTVGQDTASPYRPGIYGGLWYQVTYRWRCNDA